MRTRRTLAVLLTASLLSLAVPTTAAESEVRSYERTVLTDPLGDVTGDTVDVLGVYATERFVYDFDLDRAVDDLLQLRIATGGFGQADDGVTVRFHVYAIVEGSQQEFAADVSEDAQGNLVANPVTHGAAADLDGDSLIIWLSAETFGLAPGLVFEKVWAVTSVIASGGSILYVDVAPRDNEGQPAGTEAVAPSTRGTLTLEGPFPFVDLVPTDGVSKESVRGGDVDFNLQLVPRPGIGQDSVLVLIEATEGWVVDPSRGADAGARTRAKIPILNDQEAIDLRLRVTPTAAADMGTVGEVSVELISAAGAHETLTLDVRFGDGKVASPDFAFELLGGQATLGEVSDLRVRVVTADGVPLPPSARVAFDLIRDGRVVDTIAASHDGDGAWSESYLFPDVEGEWVLDAYVASMHPSPHASFPLRVAGAGDGGSAPGPTVPLLLIGVVAAMAAAARRRT